MRRTEKQILLACVLLAVLEVLVMVALAGIVEGAMP